MLTVAYWKRLAEDAATGVWTGLGVVVLGDGFNVLTADWKAVLGGAATGALVALVKAGLATPVGDTESPRLVK